MICPKCAVHCWWRTHFSCFQSVQHPFHNIQPRKNCKDLQCHQWEGGKVGGVCVNGSMWVSVCVTQIWKELPQEGETWIHGAFWGWWWELCWRARCRQSPAWLRVNKQQDLTMTVSHTQRKPWERKLFETFCGKVSITKIYASLEMTRCTMGKKMVDFFKTINLFILIGG